MENKIIDKQYEYIYQDFYEYFLKSFLPVYFYYILCYSFTNCYNGISWLSSILFF